MLCVIVGSMPILLGYFCGKYAIIPKAHLQIGKRVLLFCTVKRFVTSTGVRHCDSECILGSYFVTQQLTQAWTPILSGYEILNYIINIGINYY